MIRSITAGAGIHIANNSYSTPYIDMTRPSAGMVRFSGSNFEVYDGNSWIVMSSGYPQVELNQWTMETISWARNKMAEEQHMQELAAQHPTVADALEAVKHAEEQLKIVAALVDTK